jgi:NAD(P)-dependent dehydrogenase (short-subunit alcohol dehydrogenase family)
MVVNRRTQQESKMSERRIALVLGATGGIGGEVARQLAGEGWHVRALHRQPAKLSTDGTY